MKLRFYTFWAINAPLDERELCRQLDQMRNWGFDGTVFHPRFYPNKPPYLSDEYLAIVSRVILYARSIGMEFWIYDENGWPSGTVGGELLKKYPNDRQQWLELVEGESEDCVARVDHWYFGEWSVRRRYGQGVDYLRPELAQHFLEMTYERYRDGLTAAAFEHVSTFFCDEPEFGLGHAYDHLSKHGAIPWTDQLDEIYRGKRDELLQLLFVPDDGFAEARVQFREKLTDLFCQSFVAPMNEWCRRHGKRFTAHVKGEEHPLFQVPMVGSCHQVFQNLGLPGIDALERYPSGHFFPRQVASAARQFGNGDCMAECFGGAGWGAGPDDLQKFLWWLVEHGINHFVLHLFQYRLTTHAMQDWPASIPAHVTWRDAFPELLNRVRIWADRGWAKANTLVIAPYRGIMAEYDPREMADTNIHNGSTYPDTPAGRINRNFLSLVDRLQSNDTAWHVCDERTVEQHGRVSDGLLHVGNWKYKYVTIDPAARLSQEARKMLAGFQPPVNEVPYPLCSSPKMKFHSVPIHWQVRPPADNRMMLEAQASGDSVFTAGFESRIVADVRIVFADDVDDVTLNGKVVNKNQSAKCVQGSNTIRFVRRGDGPVPYLALHGEFGVFQNENSFYLAEPGLARADDLIASGYPFCFDPVTVIGRIELVQAANFLKLTEISAACARLRIDGEDYGVSSSGLWRILPLADLLPGSHSIEVDLYPSTFNSYGPHHHIDGDRPIVSPGQYEYRKNFADRPDAPESTFTEKWHLKPFGIGSQLGYT
jgi:hypothetical protein